MQHPRGRNANMAFACTCTVNSQEMNRLMQQFAALVESEVGAAVRRPHNVAVFFFLQLFGTRSA